MRGSSISTIASAPLSTPAREKARGRAVDRTLTTRLGLGELRASKAAIAARAPVD
jgi:hypothetical protein